MLVEIAAGLVVLVIGRKIYNTIDQKKQLQLKAAEEEKQAKLLDGVSITVYVRESNGSRTDLEHHLEQELISRGARLLIANQESAMALVKKGEYYSLNAEAHLALIGTLIIREGGNKQQKVFTEDEFSFKVRRAKWRQEREIWIEKSVWDNSSPEPQLRERGYKMEAVPCLLYQLSYRVIGRDGAILASGSEEELPLRDQPSFDGELRELASRAVKTLDEKNVWPDIVI